MKYSRQKYRRLNRGFASAVLALFVLPLMAGEAGLSAERFNQSAQIWRLEQAAELQRVLEVEAMLDYSAQVEGHASELPYQATVLIPVEAEPADVPAPPTAPAWWDGFVCEPDRTRC